jgi:hypothetical protein
MAAEAAALLADASNRYRVTQSEVALRAVVDRAR